MCLFDLRGLVLLHGLLTTNGLSRLSTLSASLQLSIEEILSVVGSHPFVFVRLRSTDCPGDDRIAVVLDLTICTFYARPPSGCNKHLLCPYLHLCPSVVLPNRRCQRAEECSLSHSLDTEHNRRVIRQRGLDNLPLKTLVMLVLASADPTKTFSVCHQKPKPCRERNCADLHLCYFYLCSPQLCKYGDCKAGHSFITERNVEYLERRGLAHVESNDVFALFRIVDENKCSILSPMDPINILIEHLLTTKHSIDRLESISNRFNIDNQRVVTLIREQRYQLYFQLLRPDTHRKHQGAKIALTLDLFCCTHYAQQCKNSSCPFLHLCPYNIRPMHGKCTNKTCPYDHEVLTSEHNRNIINTRGLSFISDAVLLEIARASADPTRSFWVCNDHGKKGGCSKKNQCDKLHYCYYALTDACTKPYCPHVINEDCMAYFRLKELVDQQHDDVLDAFQKVLRQRKTDFLQTIHVSSHPTWASPPSTTTVVINAHQNSLSFEQEYPLLQTPIRSTLSATAPVYNGSVSSQPIVLPEQDTDLILWDAIEQEDSVQLQRYLTEEIGCPIKLLSSKSISSTRKTFFSLSHLGRTTSFFCPIETPTDLFRLLRWQNGENPSIEPLLVYASAHHAHQATDSNIEHNHFCLLRVQLPDCNLISEHTRHLNNPSSLYFDRIWVYTYDG